MTTKTINTRKFGTIGTTDIRKTSEKISVEVGNRAYERVAWEDAKSNYWVSVKGHWYCVDSMRIAHQRHCCYSYAFTPERGVYGF